MKTPITYVIKSVVAQLGEGDIVNKFKPAPDVKPPRRCPDLKNISNRSDYMKNYMHDYRKEKGKDYQKVPDSIKKFRKNQRKKLKEKFETTITGTIPAFNIADKAIKSEDCPSSFLII